MIGFEGSEYLVLLVFGVEMKNCCVDVVYGNYKINVEGVFVVGDVCCG